MGAGGWVSPAALPILRGSGVRVGGGVCVAMWKRIAVYGLLLGLGTLALQWLDYQRMARLRMGDVYDFLLGAGFLDRQSDGSGTSVSVRVDLGGRRIFKTQIEVEAGSA